MRRFAVVPIVLVALSPVRTERAPRASHADGAPHDVLASERVGELEAPIASVQNELARVRSQIRANVPEDQRAALLQRLEPAEAALKAQRTYQALYLLEAAYDSAAAFAFATSAGVQSPNDFVKKWTEFGAPKPHRGWPGRVPAAVDALAEAAEDRGPATYQASRPYAEDSGIDAGLYYLGESHAVMNYAAFARAGTWPAVG